MTISTDWVTWGTVIAAGAVTFLARASFIVLPAETRVPQWLQRCLKYVAAAVLPALVMPDVLYRDLHAGDAVNSYRILASLVALLVAWKSRSIFATLVAGMSALWLLQYFKPF